MLPTGKIITERSPIVSVQGFDHLGIAYSDKQASLDFYAKIGFSLRNDIDSSILVLQNQGSFQLHLLPCDKPLDDDKNILMDYPANKYPGHTHAAFCVPSVVGTKTYFDLVGLVPSGERPMGNRLAAYFLRDPDRTTFEFEKNVGVDDESVVISARSIGFPRGLDHVGVRVSNPEASWLWYAETLGFTQEVSIYERNHDDILKNFRPWIARAASGIDSQLIINANETPEYNILTAGGIVRPGIIYITYTVIDVDEAAAALRANGIEVVADHQLGDDRFLSWGLRPSLALTPPDGKSVFLRDLDGNFLRLVNVRQS